MPRALTIDLGDLAQPGANAGAGQRACGQRWKGGGSVVHGGVPIGMRRMPSLPPARRPVQARSIVTLIESAIEPAAAWFARRRALGYGGRMHPHLPVPPIGPLLPWLDGAGLAVFAASGALAAARAQQTLVTFCFFALVTGTGGGTTRDLLIGAPVFWMQDGRAIAVCLVAACLVWVTPRRWQPERALDWCDALGLAAYAVYGAAKALRFGVPPLPAAMMGVVTGCMGGVLRDVIAGVPSILLRPELYVTAAALAAASFVALALIGVPAPWPAIIAAVAGFALRAAAIRRGARTADLSRVRAAGSDAGPRQGRAL